MIDAEKLITYTKKVVGYISYKPRTRNEVEEYLVKKLPTTLAQEEAAELSEAVMQKVDAYQLLDDLSYTRQYSISCYRKGKGTRWIQDKLRQKGIDRSIISQQLEEIDENEIVNSKIVRKSLAKYESYCKKHSTKHALAKTLAYLAQRGYTYDESKRIIDEMGV